MDQSRVIREVSSQTQKGKVLTSLSLRVNRPFSKPTCSNTSPHFTLHEKLQVLEQNGPEPHLVKDWNVIGQFSSVGSLGNNKEAWLTSELLTSLAATKRTGPLSLGGGSKAKLRLVSSRYNMIQPNLHPCF